MNPIATLARLWSRTPADAHRGLWLETDDHTTTPHPPRRRPGAPYSPARQITPTELADHCTPTPGLTRAPDAPTDPEDPRIAWHRLHTNLSWGVAIYPTEDRP